jgi:hypothetical protein
MAETADEGALLQRFRKALTDATPPWVRKRRIATIWNGSPQTIRPSGPSCSYCKPR